jgi:phage terminase small subunit
MGQRGPKKGVRYRKTLAKRRGIARALTIAEITAERTTLEMARCAFADLASYYREDGNFKALHELTVDQRAALAGVETVVKNAAAGDGHTDTVLKIKLWDKPRSLEMLAKHFGLLTDKLDVSGAVRIIHELAE